MSRSAHPNTEEIMEFPSCVEDGIDISTSEYTRSTLMEPHDPVERTDGSSPQLIANDDDGELSALQYARFYGLAVNHLVEPYPIEDIQLLQPSTEKLVAEDVHLPQIELPPDFSVNEHLTAGKDTAQQLASVVRETMSVSGFNSITALLLDVRKTKALREEEPLLRGNPEEDCRNFAKKNEIHLKYIKLPMDSLDDEKDEGLGWSSKLWALPADAMKKVKAEKSSVTKGDLVYLAGAIKCSWSKEDQHELDEFFYPRRKISPFAPITPPLLPISPKFTPYIPESPETELQLLSEPDSMIDLDLRRVEEEIFKNDTIEKAGPRCVHTQDNLSGGKTYTNAMPDLSSPSAWLQCSTSSPIQKRATIQDLKVEVPLLLATPTIVSNICTISNIDMPRQILCKSPEAYNEDLVQADLFFDQAMADMADYAMQSLEQEQLQTADTVQRVPVPIMDFATSDPPWAAISRKKGTVDLRNAQRAMLRALKSAPGFPSHEPMTMVVQSLLKWVPFAPEIGRVNFNEKLGVDEDWQLYLKPSAEIIDSSTATWKRPGLMILADHDSDDDELELGHLSKQKSDMASLVRKRKMIMNEEAAESDSGNKSAFVPREDVDATEVQEYQAVDKSKNGKSLRRKISKPKAKNAITDKEEAGPAFFGTPHGTVGSALDNFMEVHGNKNLIPRESSHYRGGPLITKEAKSFGIQPAQPASLPVRKATPNAQPNPTPAFTPLINPASIVISSSSFQRRSLIRTLNRLLPNLILVERSFTAHNTSVWERGKVTRSPIISSLATEADFIVSASTGIIITTLTKIKQKPLPVPSQKTRSEIRARVEDVSVRYERLVILVSEGNAGERTEGISQADCLALVEFTGFCTGLDSTVQVQYVAGGEETLAGWLVATISQLVTQDGMELLEDETLWELLLRRIGLNAYAAQAVLSQLNAPGGVDATEECKIGMFGITGFIDMEKEERILRFGGLFGGRRVLERIAAVVEQNWGQ